MTNSFPQSEARPETAKVPYGNSSQTEQFCRTLLILLSDAHNGHGLGSLLESLFLIQAWNFYHSMREVVVLRSAGQKEFIL